MEISQANDVITALRWTDDVEVLSSDRLRVAAIDPMQGVAPEMLEWWFAHMERETYLAFHPVDHEDFAWVRGKLPGRFVGATHFTQQRYGGNGPVMLAEISFIAPEELLDRSLFEPYQVGAAICAVVHLLGDDKRPEPDEAARFIHIGVRRDYGTELRSCWWLNIGPDADIDRLTVGRLRHVHEEFGYLTDFLPDLYAHTTEPVAEAK